MRGGGCARRRHGFGHRGYCVKQPLHSDYMPSWYTATMVAAPERPPLTSDLDIDVCVIGAGLAGLTAAREIARGGWSVAVLEAQRIAWNASGFNCGFVLPGFAAPIASIVERVGRERAKQLWALSEAGLDYVRRTIVEADMPGVHPVAGWLDVFKTDDEGPLNATLQLLGREFGVEVEAWTTERVRQALKSTSYFNAIHFPRAFHLHPLNYALGLAALAETAGAHIYERTPAVAIDPAGVRKRIETPQGRLRAAHVVLAGNVHIGKLLRRVGGTLVPIWTYLAATAPLGSALAEAIAYRGAVSDGERADNHYRVIDGDRLLISGRATVWPADPRRFAGALSGDIAQLYPQLGRVELAQMWSGVLGRTVHGMPQIGELSPGIWLASGFGGHGLNTTAMAGNMIARAIVDGDDSWRLFLPYELIWAGGTPGRAAAQIGIWWSRARNQIKARRARDRIARPRSPSKQAVDAAPVGQPHVAAAEPHFALPADPDLTNAPAQLAAPSAVPDATD
jgi:gamma-glutamylputrescine oxidase